MLASWLPVGAVLAVGALASAWDLNRRIVPNRLNLAALLLGLALGAVHGGAGGLMAALEGAGAGAVLFGLPWLTGGLGGGDLKLAIALGALVGWPGALPALLAGAVGMALWSAAWALGTRIRHKTAAGSLWAVAVPQAPALSLGAALAAIALAAR